MRGKRQSDARFRFVLFCMTLLLIFSGVGADLCAAGETDLDGDGLPDWWEERFSLDRTRNDSREDADGDGLTHIREFELGSHPGLVDTDADGLDDGEEADRYGTLPGVADTDGGGWSDGAEVAARRDPRNPDDDGNGGNAAFALALQRGWNLISLTVAPSDNGIDRLLAPIRGKYNILWSFQDGAWKSYDPDFPQVSTLAALEAGRGYWIDMASAAVLTVSGPPAASDIVLGTGWNLVGFNFLGALQSVSAFRGLAGDVAAVWMYSGGTWRVFDPQNPGFSDLRWLEPGFGYWIKAERPETWRIP